MNTSKIALYTNPDEVLTLTPSESIISMFEHTDENGGYSCAGVPLFRRNGYRQSSGRKPLFRNRDTALN